MLYEHSYFIECYSATKDHMDLALFSHLPGGKGGVCVCVCVRERERGREREREGERAIFHEMDKTLEKE